MLQVSKTVFAIVKKCQNCQKNVKIVKNCQKSSKIVKMLVKSCFLISLICKMSQRSQVSVVALYMSKVKVP